MRRAPTKKGRKTIKAKGRLMKFRKDLDAYLHSESEKSGKPMTLIVEELLEYRRNFKTFPPVR